MPVIGNQTNVTIAGQPISTTATPASGSANRYYQNVNNSGTNISYTVPAGTYFVGQVGTSGGALLNSNMSLGSSSTSIGSVVFGPGTTINLTASSGNCAINGILFYV